MTPRNWFNAIVGCGAAAGAIASVALDLYWLISVSLTAAALFCAVDLMYCAHLERKQTR